MLLARSRPSGPYLTSAAARIKADGLLAQQAKARVLPPVSGQRSSVRLTKWKACLKLGIDGLSVEANSKAVMPARPDTPDLNRPRVFWNVPKG